MTHAWHRPWSRAISLSRMMAVSKPVLGPSKVSTPQASIVATLADQKDPDQYTIIPASLKIIKVLVEEMVSASGARAASNAAALAVAQAEFEDDENDDWEDDDDVLDLSLGSTKNDLMSFMEGSTRQRDDETQRYLIEFFIVAARENTGNFQEWYNALTEEEKSKLNELANSAGAS